VLGATNGKFSSTRDDFSKKSRSALALQANYRCSFPTCCKATSGPSDESPKAVSYIGVAAHIHAQSPSSVGYRVFLHFKLINFPCGNTIRLKLEAAASVSFAAQPLSTECSHCCITRFEFQIYGIH
jgi:hypothetical protein